VRIYLDNAATSWPKPESVYLAVEDAMRVIGAAVGRGAYQQSLDASRLVDEAREALARLIHAPNRRNIAFMFNGTDALCTAILGLLQPGDHVVTSVVEHNSVLRPLTHLSESRQVSVSFVGCNGEGKIDSANVLSLVKPETRMVVLTHASNVTGAVQELGQVGLMCREKQIVFLVDAAQTLGYLPMDVGELNCDMLAASGHKGLLGPLGTGLLYYSDELAEQLTPLRFGGTGATRLSSELPRGYPEKFEAGNMNFPGLAGLAAALKFRQSEHWSPLLTESRNRAQRLLAGLLELPNVKLYGPKSMVERVPVFSISVSNFDSLELATVLEGSWCIQTRAGFHCAPRLHEALGTAGSGGLVRISPGLFNTDQDIDRLLQALQAIAE
jgi:cysteine desulfurase family protein